MNEQPDTDWEPPPLLDVPGLYADLGGAIEVAAMLGVSVHRLRHWIERRHQTRCPEPVAKLVMGHVFSLSEWRCWHIVWELAQGDRNADQVSTEPPAVQWNRRDPWGHSPYG